LKAIRTYAREFIAITAFIAVALVVTYVIVQEQGLRIPVIEERPFELKAEFETAQAVTPGQGQTVRVAGVRVGDVEDVELEGGVAVVTFGIERDYLPIYRDATILMRPQTALKDMFFQLDPGTRRAGEYGEGDTVPLSATAPDVTLSQILPLLDSAALDADSRAYLKLLVIGLGEGVRGRGGELGRLLGGLGPINRDFRRVNSVLERRNHELARLVHNLNVLTQAIGRRDEDVVELVGASNDALSAVAAQGPDLQRLTRELPDTLAVARATFADATPFARLLGPTLDELRPVARRLDEVAGATRDLAVRATPVIRDELRPLVRAARPAIPDLRVAAERYARAAPRLTVIGRKVNRLGNMTAYNPRGAEPAGAPGRDEGYLYWLGWFTHDAVSVFTGQDAHGPYRRLFLTGGCQQLRGLAELSPFGPVVGGLLFGVGPLFGPGGECAP
jgi:phospholipid/cholesterol/gamma-HCH transport system substrate-binding protein